MPLDANLFFILNNIIYTSFIAGVEIDLAEDLFEATDYFEWIDIFSKWLYSNFYLGELSIWEIGDDYCSLTFLKFPEIGSLYLEPYFSFCFPNYLWREDLLETEDLANSSP